MKRMGRKLIALVSVVSMLLCVGCGKEATTEEKLQLKDTELIEENVAIDKGIVHKPETYTVMIYMVGSDLESEGYCASRDILEMMDSGLDVAKTMPFSQWEGDGSVWSYQYQFEQDLKFKKKSLSDFEQNYVIQITLEDVYGNSYVSELQPIQSKADEVQVYEQNVDDGSFQWRLYADHAELLKYKGKAAVLEVPNQVSGLPVTTIRGYAFNGNTIEEIILPESITTLYSYVFGNCTSLRKVTLSEQVTGIPEGAFSGCDSLQEIVVSESVKSIGRFAFDNCKSLSDFKISAHMTDIKAGAFSNCDSLVNLTVDPMNEKYVVLDGVLFTKDMKELVACPSLFRTSYEVPEGVEVIWDFAFADCYEETYSYFTKETVGYGLVDIKLPDTLKKIGDAAFYECTRLNAINLPESLEYIGSLAFGTSDFKLGNTTNQCLECLEIGENVTWIGMEAFGGYIVENVEVSEQNKYYASEAGVLMNKAKTEKIEVFADQ